VSIKINQWKGWVPAFSRYLLPPGGAVELTNMTTLVPGQLTVRGGSRKIASTAKRMVELWGLSTGASQVILGQGDNGDIDEIVGGSATNKFKKHFTGDSPVTFSQGRRGEAYIYQGYGKRGLVRRVDKDGVGYVTLVGVEAPEDKPGITIDTSPSYYVARIDITDAGNGYHLPPTVSIAAPATGGKQATALARIADAQIAAIDVTDGGAGYEKVPCVTLTDTPNGPATGVGAEAAVELEAGAATGDPETGIVYWEISQLPNWFWLCLDGYAREGKGIIVDAVGGSGTGAKAIFWIDGVYASACAKLNASDSDFENYGVRVQAYAFGSGYQPGDVVTATIKTANGYSYGPFGYIGPLCGTTQICQVQAEGIGVYNPKAPDKLSIIDANPYKQRKIKTTVTKGGSGYLTPPVFTTEDGDIINTEVDCEGKVTKLILDQPNKVYLFPPKLVNTAGDVGGARALAIVRPNFRGKYQCYYRYVNDKVTKDQGGPVVSNLSPVNEVDAGDCAKKVTWTLTSKPPASATHIELWRSTADQAITLFRVAKLPVETGSFEDSLSDYALTDPLRPDYEAQSILLADGRLNMNRYGVPNSDFAVGVVFQDRMFLSVDTKGKRPNTILFSEADLPESIPEVNELILQTNVRNSDYITALIPYAGALMVMQSKHCYRLNFVSRPEIDATTALVAYRGCLNQRCWDQWNGLAYVLDDNGFYTLDPQGQVEDISAAIATLFRTNTDPLAPTLDFSKRQWWFVRADKNLGVIRIHVSFTGDAGEYPTRQIVYDPDSKAYWIEQYPYVFSAATEVRASDGSIQPVTASQSGLHAFSEGLTDDGTPIDYAFRSGNFAFDTDATSKTGGQQNSRNVSVVYKPTDSECLLKLGSYYNGSDIPRGHVALRDRGVGFINQTDEPAATVDMAKLPHQEAESHGVARALFAGKTIEAVYGGDTHVSIRLFGQQNNGGPIVLHSVTLEGASPSGSE
jgi:hypothetical protein